MMFRRDRIPFENPMSRTQTVLGWIYFPFHMLILPWLVDLYVTFSPNPVTETETNLIWTGLGILFVLCVMFSYLRRCFDRMLDRRRACLLALVVAPLAYYALANFLAMLMLVLNVKLAENPNDSSIASAAAGAPGIMAATGVFLAPILEEVLCRGVIFGSIRTRSRGWAYVVSLILFILPHVWPYALASQDPRLLLYTLQYIPFAVAATWAYEYSGSIWPPIFFHMGNNALWYFQQGLL